MTLEEISASTMNLPKIIYWVERRIVALLLQTQQRGMRRKKTILNLELGDDQFLNIFLVFAEKQMKTQRFSSF